MESTALKELAPIGHTGSVGSAFSAPLVSGISVVVSAVLAVFSGPAPVIAPSVMSPSTQLQFGANGNKDAIYLEALADKERLPMLSRTSIHTKFWEAFKFRLKLSHSSEIT